MSSSALTIVSADDAPADLSTVFYFTNDGNNNYTFTTQGNQNVGSQTVAGTAFSCTSNGGSTFNFSILSPGVAGIYNPASYVNDINSGYFGESSGA